MRRAAPLLALAIVSATPALAQTVSGSAYEDRNDNGVRDPGEPALPGVEVELFGTRDAGGAFDQTTTTDGAGGFSIAPGNGCYLLLPQDPPGWRLGRTRDDGFADTVPGYTFPVGKGRPAKIDHGIETLKSQGLRMTAMGDSIAWNWNSCFYTESFWYSRQLRARLACTAPAATVTLDQAAVKGEHTDDLLVDDNNDLNNVFRALELQPDLITLSMIGNDLLDAEPPANPTQTQINRAAAEILDSRQNLQEALSTLTSELPGTDLMLNSLYDNLAYNCYTGDTGIFHRQWLPIVNRILRDLAWGQARRASILEAAADFAHEDQGGTCTGFDQMICRDIFQTDLIHPNNNGYQIVREKAWEGAGGVNLGAKDVLARTSRSGEDYGFLRRVRRLLPRHWETRGGASVQDPSAATDDADGGIPARITLGIATEEFRLDGFPDWLDELQIVRVLAGVRYRTSGSVSDDFYRMEGSVTGQFRPPAGHAYTPVDWNYSTPIVGGGGPNQPPENSDYPAAKLLALPNVPAYREVSATLTKNPTLPSVSSDYIWPAITHEELASTAIRIVSAPVSATPGNDLYQVELDAAWLDLYGWEKTRPPEVTGLRVARLPDGSLDVTFDAVPAAQRYNLYFGRLATVRAGSYDHGAAAPAGPRCAASFSDAGGGRIRMLVPPGAQPGEASYILVTAHVDDVESPAGTRSGGEEIDRSQSICR